MRLNSETRLSLGDNKENMSNNNQMIKNAKNVLSGKIQTPTSHGGFMKLNTVVNTPTNKVFEEHQTSEKKAINSPLEHITPRTNIMIDKNSRNKISMLNLGKCKMISKNQRNFMKPPKKNHTMTSNRNSSSDSSFTSLGNLGAKQAFQDQYTPNHPVRGSFDVKSNNDFMHNTAHNVLRKPESACENLSPNYNCTIDPSMTNIHEMSAKGKYLSF
jgi:hypothetical protein